MASLGTFDRAYEQTYNPTHTLALVSAPRFSLTDKLQLRMWQYTTLEPFTQSDSNTYKGETTLSDTSVTLAYKAYRNEALGLGVNVGAMVGLPTSKGSIYKHTRMTPGLDLGLSWSKGIFSVATVTRGSYIWTESTTALLNNFPISGCNIGDPSCAGLDQGSSRTAEFRFFNILVLAAQPLPRLGFSATMGVINDVLHPSDPTSITNKGTGLVIPVGVASTNSNMRATMYWGLAADFKINDAWSLSAGTEVFNPQLKLNSTYESPFINRYTNVFLDVVLSPEKLFAAPSAPSKMTPGGRASNKG